MGAGRKTETYTLAHDVQSAPGYRTMSVRNLKKGDLCGVIFGCKYSTMKECSAKNLFGLPAPHMAYIKNIDPGLTLFLFNYSDRKLHGIFEATSEGKMNIDPNAWSLNGKGPSPYPAQVKIRVRMLCKPLPEEKFSPVIADNYMDEKMFLFELDRGQTNKLLRLFSSSPSARAPSASRDAAPSRKAIPASALAQIGDKGAPRVDKWSSLFKSSEDSNEKKEKDSKEGAGGAGSSLANLGKTRGWETAPNNADERKAQPSVSQPGAYFPSVLRNMTDSSTLEKKTTSTNEVPSQASKGVENPQRYASQVLSLRQDSGGFSNTSKEGEDVNVNAYHHQQILHPTQKGTSATANNIIGPSEEDPAEDITSSFKVHLERVENIVEDPKEMDCFKNFQGNMGPSSSSSMVPNFWEAEKISLGFEQMNIAKSPCGSSYVSPVTGDVADRIRRLENTMNEILLEIKELKNNHRKHSERMLYMEMTLELLKTRIEIIGLR